MSVVILFIYLFAAETKKLIVTKPWLMPWMVQPRIKYSILPKLTEPDLQLETCNLELYLA